MTSFSLCCFTWASSTLQDVAKVPENPYRAKHHHDPQCEKDGYYLKDAAGGEDSKGTVDIQPLAHYDENQVGSTNNARQLLANPREIWHADGIILTQPCRRELELDAPRYARGSIKRVGDGSFTDFPT